MCAVLANGATAESEGWGGDMVIEIAKYMCVLVCVMYIIYNQTLVMRSDRVRD